ncbi:MULTISPECIES: CZB domain-containing protein [unclassified Acidovorax]|uniref:CZB domain-containing protein n=1 Tax=unclassified Acidovorax TaxID=2684926 RepID=UPI001C470CC6|nr:MULTISPECIES: CZB domain-containing protein [unclassified Acidovorax]MBV7427750.1 CZB domain-containing protein [Acidovorax sp. sif0732]MBV7450110.1 CZB domain-containing protein [Acidovorax sp. sif0715]
MDFFRRVFGARGREAGPSLELCDSGSGSAGAQDSQRADTVLAALDIDAAINAHERWKAHLMDYLEGRTTQGLDPSEVRRGDRGALGRWLHGVGGELLGDQPAYAVLMARHQYFHEQAAMLVALAQQGEWDKAVQVLNGGYRYGSSQVVLLLKELKRGLVQQPLP